MDKQAVFEALKTVKDPGTGRDIASSGMIQDIQLDGNNINVTLQLPNNVEAKEKQEINFACIVAINQVYPTAMVNVHMTTSAGNATKAANRALPQVKNIIAIASGKGGVGKSTVSTNLALGLKQLGARVGLIDADLYGPSIPTMLGLQGKRPRIEDVYGKPKLVPIEAYGIHTMSIGYIVEPEQAVVLRGPRLSGVLTQFINDCIWPELDFLLIDLPPGTGDIQLSLVQNVPVTGAVIVTTPQEVAVVDAIKAMNMFLLPNVNVPILGVVENMAWFTPAELPDNKYFIFGQGGGKKLVKQSNSVLLGQVPIVQGIREAGDGGKPAILQEEPIAASAFLNVAKNTLRQIAIRNEYLAPTQQVTMMPE